MNELHQEWQNLADHAERELQNRYNPRAADAESLFRILVQPAFEPESVWQVLRKHPKPGSDDKRIRYLARYTCWRKDMDGEKFRNPVERLRHPRPLSPTFETAEITLDASLVEEALTRLYAITVPAYVPRETIGLDGVTYQLGIGSYFVSAEYRWWCDPPEKWQPLAAFAEKMLESLDAARTAAQNAVP